MELKLAITCINFLFSILICPHVYLSGWLLCWWAMVWYAHANKVKMCHNTKVNMWLCHLGKAVAQTDGGTAFSPEPNPPSLLPPCSAINTPKIIFCTLWHHHSWNSAAEWPLCIHHHWDLWTHFFYCAAELVCHPWNFMLYIKCQSKYIVPPVIVGKFDWRSPLFNCC